MGWLGKITSGLKRSAQGLSQQIKVTLNLHAKLDDAAKEALEEALISADCGAATSAALVTELEARGLPEPLSELALRTELAGLMAQRLKTLEGDLEISATDGPCVIVLAGVNGSGKTTTAGKLAAQWAEGGKKVVVAAADTFRAAAAEQLAVWAERAEGAAKRKGWVELVVGDKHGADSAGVAYKAVELALQKKADIVLIDTAGRLPNRTDLLAELPKLVRAVQKLIPAAPHAKLLVLDGTLGQSTLPQVAQFNAQIPLTGLIVTKLDSSGKAGFLLGLAAQKPTLPVHYIGMGEGLNDIGPFVAEAFAKGLLGIEEE
jgi:fused signal recognition particle receptor